MATALNGLPGLPGVARFGRQTHVDAQCNSRYSYLQQADASGGLRQQHHVDAARERGRRLAAAQALHREVRRHQRRRARRVRAHARSLTAQKECTVGRF